MQRGGKFFCNECGYRTTRWLGRCPSCGMWNTIVEETGVSTSAAGVSSAGAIVPEAPCPLNEVEVTGEERFLTGFSELDRVLGGGIVPGSFILLGGDPGIGKSTLLLQTAYKLSAVHGPVLYLSGEESARQIRMRAGRLGTVTDKLYLVCTNEIDNLEHYLKEYNPAAVIVDSIQAVFTSELSSAPGSVGQVRECAARLMRLAKKSGTAIFIIGHVTKEGVIAGPRVLEHMVDTVLYLEGERHHYFRILRGVKNRFGSTNEIGVFEMRDRGLVEVANPSSLFIAGRGETEATGSVVVPSIEGTRPLLVEIQALVSPTGFGTPRRMTAGLDYNRVALIMAVLDKRVGLHINSYDAYVNVVGGVKLTEPGVDLAVALALASSFREIPVNRGTIVVGEVGLTGEVRAITAVDKRIAEASRLGFERCLIPKANIKNSRLDGGKDIEILGVQTVAEAIEVGLRA